MTVDTKIQYLQENNCLAQSDKHLTEFLLTVWAVDLDDAYVQAKCCMNDEYSCPTIITFVEELLG